MSRSPLRPRVRALRRALGDALDGLVRRRALLGVISLGLGLLLGAVPSLAQSSKGEPSRPVSSGAATASARAAEPSAASSATALPEPAHDEDQEDGAPTPELPPGHPDISTMRSGGGPAGPGMRAGANSVLRDPSVPAGSVEVVLLDAEERPVAGAPIELWVMRRSADPGGEPSTEKLRATTSELGSYRFDRLQSGPSVSYRVTARRGPAEFSVEPFGLGPTEGLRVRLHTYEATSSLAEAKIDVALMVVFEIGENSISIEELVRVTTFGSKAWVPAGLELELAAGYEAFGTPETMDLVGARQLPNGKVTLVGTFAPGPADVSFSYQVPLAGTREQTIAVALPPGTTWTRMVAAAGNGMDLRVSGFAPAKASRSPDGKRILVVERRGPPSAAGSVQVTVAGLPETGSARWVALGLALAVALGGAAAAAGRGAGARAAPDDLREARDALLDEMVELERAHRDGRIDRAEYSAVRQALMDALGRLGQKLAAGARSAA
jgi:hypothetical protein